MPDPFLQRLMQSAMEHYRAGRLSQADNFFRQVLRDDPAHPGAHHMLGLIARQSGRLQEAYDHMAKSLAVSPDNASLLLNVAQVCLLLRKPAEAVDHLTKARALDPANPAMDRLLIMSYIEVRRFADAQALLEPLLAGAPDDPELLAWLAVAIAALQGPDAALPHLERAVAVAPTVAHYSAMLGKTLRDCGRTADARLAYESAFRLDPKLDGARLNYAIILLQLGIMPQAWDAWDARPAVAIELPKARYKRPLWVGGPAHGTILLRAEQGFGDVIQFIRYAPMVAQCGLSISVECHKELLRLIGTAPSVGAVFPGGSPPDCNYQQLIMSLPRVFRTTLDDIPASVPYLSVDFLSREAWAQRLGPPSGKWRVGLAWAGRPTHTNDHNRSITLESLAPLAALPNIEFHQLQLGPAAKQPPSPGLTLIDHTAHFTDFYETAALISHLDLVITVDTALAHLAGALAKPVWTLIPFVPDWRWMDHRLDSPWYPTMRLFRQPQIGQWQPVIAGVADALRQYTSGAPG